MNLLNNHAQALFISVYGGDTGKPNAAGGEEAIFVRRSRVEAGYSRFDNCTIPAQ